MRKILAGIVISLSAINAYAERWLFLDQFDLLKVYYDHDSIEDVDADQEIFEVKSKTVMGANTQYVARGDYSISTVLIDCHNGAVKITGIKFYDKAGKYLHPNHKQYDWENPQADTPYAAVGSVVCTIKIPNYLKEIQDNAV